jgi:phospholipid transport system substrate-binding protein
MDLAGDSFMRAFTEMALVILILAQSASMIAAAQIETARNGIENLLAVVNAPRTSEDDRDRREKIKKAIHQRFDFAEIAKRSLGSEWRRRTANEQREFVGLFTALAEHAYLAIVDNIDRARLLKDTTDEGYAEVKTQIIDNKGTELLVDYRLHQVKRDWKVYDVVVENVSVVNNYRIQFARVLAMHSYAELIARMKARGFDIQNEMRASR